MKACRQLLLILVAILLPALNLMAADLGYHAELAGKNEAPQVKTPATGTLKMVLSGNELTFLLNVDGITSPTSAAIHSGRKGENGPPVAGLFGGPAKPGAFRGILATGKITGKNLLGELQGKTLAELVRLLDSGQAYVNVLTETYPAGEIRGQIRRGKDGRWPVQ
jgi:hypothetical protein